MNKIYTKTGDEGMTSIRGGVRIPKDHPRIEANGMLDELNAMLGVARTLMPKDDERQALLTEIIHELMRVMSHVATPQDKTNPRQLHVDGLTERMEQRMDEVMAKIEEHGHFIVPTGSIASAEIHIARTIARQAERRLWTVNRDYPIDPSVMRFMNRLSDFLFVMTKEQLQKEGIAPEDWK